MKKNMRRGAAAFFAAALSVVFSCAGADAALLPDVTPGMADPLYWQTETDSALLSDEQTVKKVNASALACPDCRMTDLTGVFPSYDGAAFQRDLLRAAMGDLTSFLSSGYYSASGDPFSWTEAKEILQSIEGAQAEGERDVRWGICVEVSDVRALPTDSIITDSPGDLDFDVVQMSNLRVNEPVVVRAETADGSWYYCDSVCVSGWVRSEGIALCADREEWLNAWCIPEEELLVVTDSKLYLDRANVNSAVSERMLTMGTTLRRIGEEEYDAAVTNRAAFHNYAVWLPVRGEDGRYSKAPALIPARYGVSEGYLPLTEENLLKTAFSALGDAYGWGGMLAVPDCSLLVRNVYKCFGLEIPRNTTWQSAMPAWKTDLSGMDTEQKQAFLDTLPAGTVLFFKGHEMLYLGEENGRHYVLSSVSSIRDPEGTSILRIRDVLINSLEGTWRASGKTWLEALDLALIPYLPEAGTEDLQDAA